MASDFDEADWAPAKAGPKIAAPDPTSAIAPPPMLLATDAGVAPAPDRSGQSDCAADCQQTFDACRQHCKTPPCEKACSARYKKCAKRCGN